MLWGHPAGPHLSQLVKVNLRMMSCMCQGLLTGCDQRAPHTGMLFPQTHNSSLFMRKHIRLGNMSQNAL